MTVRGTTTVERSYSHSLGSWHVLFLSIVMIRDCTNNTTPQVMIVMGEWTYNLIPLRPFILECISRDMLTGASIQSTCTVCDLRVVAVNRTFLCNSALIWRVEMFVLLTIVIGHSSEKELGSVVLVYLYCIRMFFTVRIAALMEGRWRIKLNLLVYLAVNLTLLDLTFALDGWLEVYIDVSVFCILFVSFSTYNYGHLVFIWCRNLEINWRIVVKLKSNEKRYMLCLLL